MFSMNKRLTYQVFSAIRNCDTSIPDMHCQQFHLTLSMTCKPIRYTDLKFISPDFMVVIKAS